MPREPLEETASAALGPGRGLRAERTRRALLDHAETVFAERGYAATRLEDVALRVGIRRASIVYHFRDKAALYDAVLGEVFGGLHERLAVALGSPDALPDRIEAAVRAWVAYVGGRPTTARILLREIADAAPGHEVPLRAHTRPYFDLIRAEVFERSRAESRRLAAIDPVHVASTIAGSTVFFVAAMPLLVPDAGLNPLAPERLAAHEAELLEIVRRLLGTGAQ